jgi:hypothetical protein
MTSRTVRFAAKSGVLGAALVMASIVHTQGVSTSKANDLENQFEHALIDRDFGLHSIRLNQDGVFFESTPASGFGLLNSAQWTSN